MIDFGIQSPTKLVLGSISILHVWQVEIFICSNLKYISMDNFYMESDCEVVIWLKKPFCVNDV